MQLTNHIHLIGSGRMGFNLSDEFDCHVYLIRDGNDAVIIDAGAGVDIQPILGQIDRSGVPRETIRHLLLTHTHPDHGGGTRALHDTLGLEVCASPTVASAVRTADEHAAGFDRLVGPGGYPEGYGFLSCPVAGELSDGDRIPIGNLSLEVVETPGHCRGHLSYVLHRPGGADLLSGDAIFAQGRILLQNLIDCSVAESCDSVRRLAGIKPDGLYPGHGSVAIERGWMHIYSAMENVLSGVPPAQLNS